MAMDFGAGCLGGAAGVIVGQPFDTVKVRLQVQHGSGAKNKYRGIFDCVFKMIKQESISSLYKGMTPPLLGLAFQNALIFGFQAQFRNFTDDSVRGEITAGALTGAVQAGVTSPIELAKIKLQIQGTGGNVKLETRKYKGPIQTLLKIHQEGGIRAVFSGFTGVLLRDVPCTAIYFGSFAYLNSLFIPEDGTIDSLTPVQLLFTGGCAGMLSWAALYPTDVMKTRVQAEGIGVHGRYKSYLDCVVTSAREEGYSWATRGFWATMLRAFPVNAAILATVTLVLRFVRPENQRYDVDLQQE